MMKKFFPNKLKQPEILINKWKEINKEIIICKMKNKSNAVYDYFEFLLEIIRQLFFVNIS